MFESKCQNRTNTCPCKWCSNDYNEYFVIFIQFDEVKSPTLLLRKKISFYVSVSSFKSLLIIDWVVIVWNKVGLIHNLTLFPTLNVHDTTNYDLIFTFKFFFIFNQFFKWFIYMKFRHYFIHFALLISICVCVCWISKVKPVNQVAVIMWNSKKIIEMRWSLWVLNPHGLVHPKWKSFIQVRALTFTPSSVMLTSENVGAAAI